MNKIENILNSKRGAAFVTIVTDTEPKMLKTNNPFIGKIRKHSRYNGQVNFQYDTAVERQLMKEGKSIDDFRRGESWHSPVIREDGTLTPFCEHKKNKARYLRFRILNTIDSCYKDTNGNVVERDTLEKFIPENNNYANQGTDDPVKIITVALDNVKSITLDGKTITND